MSTLSLILVRHGETEWNLQRRMQGQRDSPLTPLGVRQARCVRAGLAREPLDHVYTSDLERAVRTAEHIAEGREIAICTEPELRERNFGIFQGLTADEIRDRHPREFAAYASGDADYVIPGGESQRAFWERSVRCLERIKDRHGGRRVLVVLHGGVLNVQIKHVLGVPMGSSRPFRLYNAAINRVSFGPEGWSVETLGDTHHLERITASEASVY